MLSCHILKTLQINPMGWFAKIQRLEKGVLKQLTRLGLTESTKYSSINYILEGGVENKFAHNGIIQYSDMAARDCRSNLSAHNQL